MNQKYSLNNAWMKLAPVGQSFFEQLIHYCTTQGDQAENYALEIKGADVNPADKVGGAKIAKFIIGASNRDPIKARDFFAGHAIMLVGLGNGSAEGIDQVELLRINNVVEKYFGDQSPRWDIQWLDLPTNSAKKILAIIVAPPSLGDPIYFSHSDGEGIKDGEICVRSPGQTRMANSNDLTKLFKQLSSRKDIEEPFELEVKLQCNQFSELPKATDLLRQYVLKRSEKLESRLPSKQRDTPFGISIESLSLYKEERSEADYKKQIQTWKYRALESIDASTRKALCAFFSPLEITINNNSELFIRELEIKFFPDFPSRVSILKRSKENRKNTITSALPKEPKPWKSSYYTMQKQIAENFKKVSFGVDSIQTIPIKHSFIWDNESKTGELYLKELRPRDSVTFQFERYFCIVSDSGVTEIKLPWKATLAGKNRLYEGNAKIMVVKSTALKDFELTINELMHTE